MALCTEQTTPLRTTDLSNVKKRREASWELAGIIRSKKGRGTKASREFKRLMGFD